VHHALKLRPVDQIKCTFFAGKHLERDAPRSGDHASGLFRRQIASGNGVERQVYENAQTANAPAFFVDLLLSGRAATLLNGFHDWPVAATQIIMNSRGGACNSTESGCFTYFVRFFDYTFRARIRIMTTHPEKERVVNAYTAGSATEAMVIRGLLESAGIRSPNPVTADPFPLNEPPEGTHGVEIYVLESQRDEARRIIEDYLQGDEATADPEE
jgi:Putative prokaryotic signal transducing protein